ncbi:MAG: uracil-DNA glycosylase [Candidatus Nanoclepta minutus]|uniref:Type-4 uracil-DNA glycosylase n=1 Tax=Candidatus Nanoclepta minutus TaxID=1940235 RepID=A0A397WSE6_9ARCH|nr:MAG: uracil-DNA glycosylase [Candidatus Nanoclepta minutus]
MDKGEEIEKINREINQCKRCPLYQSKINYVPGEGDPSSEIMFIGEAPGREEDKQGRPFVGNAGKYLTETIEKILEIKREDIFITNVLKCRPPNNRDPKEEEIEACSIWLIRQIETIKPRIIVTLGRHSSKFIFSYFGLEFTNIMNERGKIRKVRKWDKDVYIIPTLHPAAVLYHQNWRELFEKDFNTIRSVIEGKYKNKRTSILDYFNEDKESN